MSRPLAATLALALPLALAGLAIARTPAPPPVPEGVIGLAPVEAPTCDLAGSDPSRGSAGERSDEAGRVAAQKGLDFLQAQAVAWDRQHRCFGCHVHAVTAEALAVGVANQYDVDRKAFQAVVAGMTTGPGGSRQPQGLDYAHGHSLRAASKGFGGAAFARYDAMVGRELGDDLLGTAGALLELQGDDGLIADPEGWTNVPVGVGAVQLTTQALSTWRQAYERTADDAWLAAIGKGEAGLRAKVAGLDPVATDHQTLVYGLIGLLDAGAGPSHPDVKRLLHGLTSRQSPTGQWSMGTGSLAYATGQALYVLRKAGFTDRDPAVARGTAWLAGAQQPDGGWSHNGFGKAEAMWGVLGLVSIDVLTLTVDGLADGQRVEGRIPVSAVARDNQGRGVRDVQITVDDVRIGAACGDTLAATWDTSGLTDGAHVVEVRATNARGDSARRRFVVYSGATRLVEAGSRWEDGGTLLSVRDLAAEGVPHRVGLTIHALAGEGAEAGPVVHETWTEGRPGALKFWWDGQDAAGTAQARGKYLARLAWTAGDGTVVHQLDHVFVHAAPEAQRATYGQLGGRIQFDDGSSAANAEVELVDEAGNVVRRSRSTSTGQWQFKNVDASKYTVRIRKESDEGTKEAEIDFEAEAGETASTDVAL